MASVKAKDGTNAMPDDQEEVESPGRDEPKRNEPIAYRSAGSAAGSAAVEKKSGPGFFTIYKKGQGYWTRIGTVMTAGLIAIFTMQFIYDKTRIYGPKTAYLSAGIFFAIFALFVFWTTNKPNVVDFLIATDSEMKKVNWTTKAELIGSTKVVILFMLIIMILLFSFDTIFGYLFKFIHVLQVGPFG